jgi:hypothetical protein
MTDHFDDAVWTRMERRLSGVEAFIPEGPAWNPSTTARMDGGVRLGRAVQSSAVSRPRRSPLVLVFVLILLLTLLVGALLVGAG